MKLLKKIYYAIVFIGYYLVKLVQSNFYIAYDILTPKMHMKPAIMEVPVILNTDAGLLLFSNLLSMTPGTLSIDVSSDKKTLLVHVLYFSTNEIMQKDFDGMQHKIKRITE
ncbi:MAG: Na+/H+ antiporter subunit E [Mariniphaga sp.]